jgi:hypothetical protein
MPSVGFALTTPVFERAKTVHALGSTATVIGQVKSCVCLIKHHATKIYECKVKLKSSAFRDVTPCSPIKQPTFRRNMSPPSSWSNSKPSKRPAWNRQGAHSEPLEVVERGIRSVSGIEHEYLCHPAPILVTRLTELPRLYQTVVQGYVP